MNISNTLRVILAASLLMASEFAVAQVYTWKDPATGQSRFSTIAPSWYKRNEKISGPRVVVTIGNKVIDDTALAYEDRLRLSGKSQEYINNLRLIKQAAPATAQDPNPQPAASIGGAGQAAPKTERRG